MLKMHSKYAITLRKIVVYLLVAVEILNLFLLRYLYESQVSMLEKIITEFNIMNKNSEKWGIQKIFYSCGRDIDFSGGGAKYVFLKLYIYLKREGIKRMLCRYWVFIPVLPRHHARHT